MGIFRGFQIAARESGFVELEPFADGTVQWFRKTDSRQGPQVDQRLCIDKLTNSATVYSSTAHGKVDSKTFRGVSNLREWFALGSSNDKS
jgi:hypothetical protein